MLVHRRDDCSGGGGFGIFGHDFDFKTGSNEQNVQWGEKSCALPIRNKL